MRSRGRERNTISMMDTFVMVETYSQEIRLELDGPGQVWQGGFGFSHCQEDRGSLVEGQVVLCVSLCEAQSPETCHFNFSEGASM